ncbi:nicotinate-nucleotide adenylyltransferase [Mycoplasmopsis glycophila]|uniref:Probable nicotinate-nucleotide adenylyltransferase n=1 Tax=Mycoplasmopsis glycophila TaxID=171285 RepID=A0A449AUN0_9BACT|nr:nicotinate-nucleotide adenylyltransferase [Mycoplasmopsis glycophila]VEU70217.1 Probable nicotinate-nucleotide adenylyltransferase [Mycoplasmopsis glycophila]
MKIGIYGGSFDPIHIGHIEVAKYVRDELKLDKMIFVPTNCSPFKKKAKKASNEDKINMINLVLEDKMELSDFEIKKGGVNYTIDTIRYFSKKYPNDELFFIIGSDNLPQLHKWKEIEEISILAKIVVVKRSSKINKTNLKKYNCLLLNNKLFDFSSTEIKKGYLDMLDPKVLNYIQNKGLYLEMIIHNSLSALRAKHSVATASFAAELAKKHGLDAKKAYMAGLIHDIAKEWTYENSKAFVNEFYPGLNIPKHKMHQLCGKLWAKHCYGVTDLEILHAIEFHTTMDYNFSDFDKVIFIADKICDGRKYPGIQKVREKVFEDLELGFKLVVENNLEQIKASGVTLDDEAIKLYQYFLK